MSSLRLTHQNIITHFISLCQTDERIVAAFLGGSYARNATDIYSDIDLSMIISDHAYEAFWIDIESFIKELGEPIFLERYSEAGFDSVFFNFAEEVECELVLGRQSSFTHIHVGPFQVLVDKEQILASVVFPRPSVAQAEQIEKLRSMISWFWHDLNHHFIAPLARERLWSAYGGLQALRLVCVNLLRLSEDFSAPLNDYEKIEDAVITERLVSLEATCCILERGAMLQAVSQVVKVYQELATDLSRRYGITYPATLETETITRLVKLGMVG